MAEQEQSRSEAATPFKLQEAKKRGQVAKSLEMNSLFALVGLLVVMVGWGRGMVHDVAQLSATVLDHAHRLDFAIPHLASWLAEMFRQLLHAVAPLLLVVVAVAILGNLVQTGPVFTTFPLKPDVQRLNPITGFKRVFSLRLLFEFGKNLVKLLLFGAVLYTLIRDLLPPLLGFLALDPVSYTGRTLDLAVDVVLALTAVFAFIALADLVYTRWNFADTQKMSRREVRDEIKHREGDPRIRARLRELRRENLARARSLRRVPEADVLITNPTHLAVALLYQREKMAAPALVAKGAGELAAQMRTLARRHGVPVVENPSLARALYRRTGVDQPIPEALFPVVARLLVWVYALRPSGTGAAGPLSPAGMPRSAKGASP